MLGGLVQQIALISESDKVDLFETVLISAALQKQVTRDFAPIWEVSGTVDAFASLEDMPPGYWPMIIMDDIGFDAAGIHLDRDGQPFALITARDNLNDVCLTSSHECLEMLADPLGNRLVPGDSPKADQGRVLFLVEVCDPSEAAEFGYSSNGLLVSDFYTPRYFDPIAANGVRYSFVGAISEPREVLSGGYLSWKDPETEHWWQEIWFTGNQSQFRDLGKDDSGEGSARAFIDRNTAEETYKATAKDRKVMTAAGIAPDRVQSSSVAKAAALREDIATVMGGPPATNATKRGGSGRRRPRRVRS